MSISPKQRQLLMKSRKKRLDRPASSIVAKPLKMKIGERNRYTSKHAVVLLAIETTIVDFFEQDGELDDATVAAALISSIRREAPPSAAQPLCRTLNEQRDVLNFPERSDVWIDGLRAIYRSVCDLRETGRGKTVYLRYAQEFVANATSGRK